MGQREFCLEQSYPEFLELVGIYALPCDWEGRLRPGTLFYTELSAYSLRIGCKGHDRTVYCSDFWITPLLEGGIRVATTLPESLPLVEEKKGRMIPRGLLSTTLFLIWLIPLWLILGLFVTPGAVFIGALLFVVGRTSHLSQKEWDNRDYEIRWRKLLIEELKLPLQEDVGRQGRC